MPENERRASLLAALALWLVAVVLVGVGVELVVLLSICEDGDGCLSAAERLGWGAVPIALTALPLWPAMAFLFRWRGHSRETVGRRAPALAAVLLAAYALCVGAVAWRFASEEVIYGNGAWLAFWAAALVGWLSLGLGLVLPRRRGLLLAALPAAALVAAAALTLVPESIPDGTAGQVAQRLDAADGCIGFEHRAYELNPRAWPGAMHPALTRRAASLELVRCRRSHTETLGEGAVWTFGDAAAAAAAVRAAGPGDTPVCLAGREVVDAYANSVTSYGWLAELCRVGLGGELRKIPSGP